MTRPSATLMLSLLACLACAPGRTLGQESARTKCEAFAERLKSENTGEREKAAVALGDLGPEGACAVRDLREATHDPEWLGVKQEAVRALGRIGPRAMDAIPDLFCAARDREVGPQPVLEALTALGPAAIPRLIPYLEVKRDEEGEVTVENTSGLAARVLGKMGAAALPSLVDGLERLSLREGAAVALYHMGRAAGPAVPPLLKAYNAAGDDESGIYDRRAIIIALIAIGEGACAARPLLEQVLAKERMPGQVGDPSYDVQRLETALKKLANCPLVKAR